MKLDVRKVNTNDKDSASFLKTKAAFVGLPLIQALSIIASIFLLLNPAFSETRERLPGKSKRGRLAISELQTRGALYEVAHRHKFSSGELRKIFDTDASLVLDPTLSLYYEDAALVTQKGTAAVDATMVAAASAYPLADTFRLHSRPGASRTIYLDFNGHVISGTAWNSNYNGGSDIVAPAWSLDSDLTSFSDQERTAIQDIWSRVSEDYASFDVDVTTELVDESALNRSSSTDEVYGTRALISPISSYFCPTGCGGVAYVGVFNYVGADTYKPALVFPERLSNGSKYIAEAISHEVGHNLGLSHDGTTTGTSYYQGHGTGETGWAPIMGVGYYKNLTQWSKGEYPYANNTQDDLTVIQRYGLTLRSDDHGNTAAAATSLTTGSSFSARGVLESRADVDLFRFYSSGGSLLLDVKIASLVGNADLEVKLLDANDVVVASVNPVLELSASLSADLKAGYYFISVDGVGKGDLATGYSDYASSGQYEVAGILLGSSTPTPQPSATASPTASATSTSTPTATPTSTQTPSITSSPTATATYSPTYTYTPTPTATPTRTATSTATRTATPTATSTPIRTVTPTATPTKPPRSNNRTMRVESVKIEVVGTIRGETLVKGKVKVVDTDGKPVAAALVSVEVKGVVSPGVLQRSTNPGGLATFEAPVVKGRVASMTVLAVAKEGYVFEPSQIRVSAQSIATSKNARTRSRRNSAKYER